jgi:hypothetical protein
MEAIEFWDKRCYLNFVKFIWLKKNTEHTLRPGHLPDTMTWERVYLDSEGEEFPAPDFPDRFAREAEIDGVTYRIIYALTGPEEVFPITGFRISSRRRTRRTS